MRYYIFFNISKLMFSFVCAVYVFHQKDSKYSYKCEIRSCVENSNRPTSTMWVNMLARGGQVFFS